MGALEGEVFEAGHGRVRPTVVAKSPRARLFEDTVVGERFGVVARFAFNALLGQEDRKNVQSNRVKRSRNPSDKVVRSRCALLKPRLATESLIGIHVAVGN